MAPIWRSGFDRGTAIGRYFPTTFGSPAPLISTAAKRSGTHGLHLQQQWNACRAVMPAQHATLILHMGIKINTNAVQRALLKFMDAGTPQVNMDLLADNSVKFYRGDTGVPLGSTSSAKILAGYRHLIVKVVFHGTTGLIEVKFDNILISGGMGLTGLDTTVSANNYATQIQLGDNTNFNEARSIYIDDVVVDDAAYLSDMRYQTRFPNAAGDSSQFTIAGSSPAATRHESVDELEPDDDVTKVTETIAGRRDHYKYPALTITSGTIGDQVTWQYSKKSDFGARVGRNVIKGGVGGGAPTTEANSADIMLGTTYADASGEALINPATGVAFTIPEANLMQAGPGVSS